MDSLSFVIVFQGYEFQLNLYHICYTDIVNLRVRPHRSLEIIWFCDFLYPICMLQSQQVNPHTL